MDWLLRIYSNEQYMLQLLSAEALFCMSLPKRGKFALRAALSVAVCFVASWFVMDNVWAVAEFLHYFPAVFFLMFALVTTAVFFCFGKSVGNILFCVFEGYLMQNIANNFYQIVCDFLLDYMWLQVIMMFVVYAAVYTACYFLFVRKLYTGECVNIDNRFIIFIGGVVVLSCFIIHGFALSVSDLAAKTAFRVSIIITGILDLLFSFGVLAGEQNRQEREMLERLLLEKKQQYETASENIEVLNTYCHDLRHFAHATLGKESTGLVADLEKSIATYDGFYRTGNKALDVALTEKNIVCVKDNIKLNAMCDGEKLDFMPAYEIYALFGNILDNAIEAVRELPDDMRVIKLKISARDEIVSIRQQNFTDKPLSLLHGLPQTTKDDKTLHGYGVKSINRIVRNHDGKCIFRHDDNVFILDILLPLSKKGDS